jgi:UDP-N-acetylglucosamine 4,6-dehydratase
VRVLVTGATGSFGKRVLRALLARDDVEQVVAFSRDEMKQFTLAHDLPGGARVRWVLGDVRDQDALIRASRGVDVIIHAAALKQVVACEMNPLEAIKTNVTGAANVVAAALHSRVQRVVSLSTDKAVSPVNLYGATKLCAEKLITAAATSTNDCSTRFCSVRWGNVLGSRGSVVPFFMHRRKTGVLPVTDPRMTRFWITLEQAVALVLEVLDVMVGGEVFVPKVPSMRIVDLAQSLAPECRIEYIGLRPGEKLDEVLVTIDEARHCLESPIGYIVYSELSPVPAYPGLEVRPAPERWEYNSGTNDAWLAPDDLQRLLASTVVEPY